MEQSIALDYYGQGINKKGINTEYTLAIDAVAKKIILKNRHFELQIILTDLVDMENLIEFVEGKKKKTVLLSHLNKDGKDYKGKKKLIWKNENIAISQGGIRIEFGPDCHDTLKKIAKFIKESYIK